VGFDDKIRHSFGFKGCASPCSAHIKFFKRKRKKRKPLVQVEGFKKASFFDKILPDILAEVWI